MQIFHFNTLPFVKPWKSFTLYTSMVYLVVKVSINIWVHFTFVSRYIFIRVFIITVVISVIEFSLVLGLKVDDYLLINQNILQIIHSLWDCQTFIHKENSKYLFHRVMIMKTSLYKLKNIFVSKILKLVELKMTIKFTF